MKEPARGTEALMFLPTVNPEAGTTVLALLSVHGELVGEWDGQNLNVPAVS